MRLNWVVFLVFPESVLLRDDIDRGSKQVKNLNLNLLDEEYNRSQPLQSFLQPLEQEGEIISASDGSRLEAASTSTSSPPPQLLISAEWT